MRAFVQRPFAFGVVSLAAVLSGRALAQSDSATAATNAASETEEITVRGRKTLTQYRVELEEAREELIEVFNEENSGDDSDVTCRNERPTGTRMPQRICRSNAQSAAEASSARWFLNALFSSAGNYLVAGGEPGPQVNAIIGTGVAQGDTVTGTEDARAKVEAELERLQRENRRLYRAALKYVELEGEYHEARKELGQ